MFLNGLLVIILTTHRHDVIVSDYTEIWSMKKGKEITPNHT